MIFAGIDVGSRAIKVVLVDAAGAVVGRGTADQGVEQPRLARELFERILAEQGMAAGVVRAVVATGYGRNGVDFAGTTVTEITCHARGVRHLAPAVRTVIEIGGQDSKLLRLDETGAVRDFAMNDRCAAGTGRFLELAAARLGVDLERVGDLARRSRQPAVISSMCAVFAETEIIGLLASGAKGEDILAGVQASIAARVAAMAGRSLAEPIGFTGGVALVGGMDAALAAALGKPVAVVPWPQYTGALGAALLAAKR